MDAFQDIQRYRYFNTNNIWINLKALKTLFDEQKMLDLPLILNPKTLDPRDDTSPPVYQLESAMGAAISLFDGAAAVRVPRNRFFPVKTCNDLLALRSDCFLYTDDQSLLMNPEREELGRHDVVKVKLDPKYYSKIDGLDERFGDGVPSLVNCDSLTIEVDVGFDAKTFTQGYIGHKVSVDILRLFMYST
jgi:UTP--glucose-1-phosphate uridylyltransferase